MSGRTKPKLLVVVSVLAAAVIGFHAEAQPIPSPAAQSPAPIPPPAVPAETAPSCKTLSKASAGGASVVQASDESLQHKSWQAKGGEIQFAVKSLVAIPADASVVVCFRWKGKFDSKAEFIEKLPSRLELSSDGKLLKVTTAVPDDLGPRPDDVATAMPLVPLAEVRVLAIDNKKKELAADASTAIGITYPVAGLILAIATAALALGVLYIVVMRRLTHPGILQANWLLRIISTPSGFASLSQFQIVLWTFVVAVSAVYVMSLSGQLIQITNGMLVLLGIAGLAGIGAKAHSEALGATAEATAAKAVAAKAAADIDAAQKAAEAAVPPADPVAAARVAAVNDVAAAQAAAQGGIADATKARADALKNPPPDQIPRWSDLIVTETVQDDGTRTREIDVARFQMLLFTLITAAFVLMTVITTYVIPEISTGFQTLLGISNGVYIGSKIVQRS
jgi:hypothetical protein